jgi:ATP-dependent DNA ligase
LAEIARALGNPLVTLDGGLVCLRREGARTSLGFARRLCGSAAPRYPAVLQVFDALHLNGQSTRTLAYS